MKALASYLKLVKWCKTHHEVNQQFISYMMDSFMSCWLDEYDHMMTGDGHSENAILFNECAISIGCPVRIPLKLTEMM